MYTVNIRHKGDEKSTSYKIYRQDEADIANITYSYWKEASAGEYAVSDANYVAKVISKFATNYISGSYNVSCPENLSVKQIAEIVKDAVGYKGSIKFNGQHNGVHRKDVNCSKLLKQYDVKFTPLKEGVNFVYDKVKDSLLCGS